MKATRSQVTWFRLRRSGLVRRYPTPEAAAAALIGIQAQLPVAAVVATWHRAEGVTSDVLQERLAERRTLVRLWGQRNTVHFYRTSDWPLLHAAFLDRSPLLKRRLEKDPELGREFDDMVRAVEARLRAGEVLGYKDLAGVDFGHDPWVAAYAVFLYLCRQGVAAHAAAGQQARFVHRRVWLPDLAWEPPDPDDANVEVARRYLSGYGPATVQDLAFWHGSGVGKARRWLGALADEIAEVEVAGETLLALHEDLDELMGKPPPASRWPVRLLHRFDPLLLAVKDKSWLIAPEHYKQVWRSAAQVAAVMLVRGRIAGTWGYDRRAAGIRFTLEPFDRLSKAAEKGLEAQARRIAELVGAELADFRVART